MTFKKIFFCIALLSAPLPAVASEIIFLTHDIEGHSYIDQQGELRGLKNLGRRAFDIELVREMRIRMGHSKRLYQVYNFRRGFDLILENKAHYALFNTGRKPAREDKMKWVGPLTDNTIYPYELKAVPTGASKLEQAKKFSICVGSGGNQDDFITQNGFQSITRNVQDTACFKMLAAKRVRLVVASEYGLTGHLQNAGISPDLIQRLPFPLYRVQGYISFTKNVPDAVIQQWQSVLDDIKASGRYDELAHEYLGAQ